MRFLIEGSLQMRLSHLPFQINFRAQRGQRSSLHVVRRQGGQVAAVDVGSAPLEQDRERQEKAMLYVRGDNLER